MSDPHLKEPPLKPGDNVRVRAGGVAMTVERIDLRVDPPYAQCVWMGTHHKMHKGYVRLDAIERVPPEGPAPP